MGRNVQGAKRSVTVRKGVQNQAVYSSVRCEPLNSDVKSVMFEYKRSWRMEI